MKKKSPTNQLVLQLTFNKPSPAVLRTLATLAEVAEESFSKNPVQPSKKNSDAPRHPDGFASDEINRTVKEEDKPLRKRLHQLVGNIAITTKQDWHTVWVLAYHKFFKLTNRHPVSESIRLGLPTHLDFVFTDPSWPGVLHNVLDEMLTNPNA